VLARPASRGPPPRRHRGRLPVSWHRIIRGEVRLVRAGGARQHELSVRLRRRCPGVRKSVSGRGTDHALLILFARRRSALDQILPLRDSPLGTRRRRQTSTPPALARRYDRDFRTRSASASAAPRVRLWPRWVERANSPTTAKPKGRPTGTVWAPFRPLVSPHAQNAFSRREEREFRQTSSRPRPRAPTARPSTATGRRTPCRS